MKSCFFAGTADYTAHIAFTKDVEGRLAAIAKTIVRQEAQMDNVSDFETKNVPSSPKSMLPHTICDPRGKLRQRGMGNIPDLMRLAHQKLIEMVNISWTNTQQRVSEAS